MKYLVTASIIALLCLNLWSIHEGFTNAHEHRKNLTGAIAIITHRACNAPNV